MNASVTAVEENFLVFLFKFDVVFARASGTLGEKHPAPGGTAFFSFNSAAYGAFGTIRNCMRDEFRSLWFAGVCRHFPRPGYIYPKIQEALMAMKLVAFGTNG